MNKEKLRANREKAGLSQLELATKLGLKRTTITKWESGENSPNSAIVPSIAKTLKCKIQDLF